MKAELRNGIFDQNPVFVQALGLCPLLAITTSMKNAVGMGVAALCTLIFSNAIVSLLRRWIPYKVRIPCYLIISATIVSIVDLFIKSYFPGLAISLGIFIPLLAVNCIIIGRSDAFAIKNKIIPSIVDAISIGFGFTVVLLLCAFFREAAGANSLFGARCIPHAAGMQALTYACGGFFSIALVLGVVNYLKMTRGKKR